MPQNRFEYPIEEISEFNPSDLSNMVNYCAKELLTRTAYPLELPAPFPGAGIYALFYNGDFPLYQCSAIRSPDCSVPIYVGRARQTKSSGRQPLYGRLRDHAASIADAANLELSDFRCRFLVLQPIWVSTVEDLLIEHYDSLWNTVVKGFGVHDPGGKRHTGDIPHWDVLHPGRRHYRTMLERGANPGDPDRIAIAISSFCEEHAERGSESTIADLEVPTGNSASPRSE